MAKTNKHYSKAINTSIDDTEVQKAVNSISDINLTGGYTLATENKTEVYKNAYTKLPVKMSTSGLIKIYILHIMIKLKRETYGREIITMINEKYDEKIWSPKHNTLYPVMNSMMRDGLIECTYRDMKKRIYYYKITDLGVKEYKEFFNDLYNDLNDDTINVDRI